LSRWQDIKPEVKAMKIFLTGGTGYVGRDLVGRLRSAGHEVRCLVRRESAAKLADMPGVETVVGDITDRAGLKGKLDGCEAAINLVGIIKEMPSQGVTFERVHYEGARNVIDEAVRAGIGRFLQMSALGAREGAKSRYHQTKYQAEQYLKQSGLKFTIFRPSIIFGPRDQSINLMAGIIKVSPVFPVIGNGRNKWQPVALENVTQGFVAALTSSSAVNKIYQVGGPQAMEYDQVLDTIAGVLGRRIIKIHQPVSLIKPVVSIMERFPFFPLSRDQLIMLQEDNICDAAPFFDELRIQPIAFKEGISRYLK
jgi:NADH dehydrogenase